VSAATASNPASLDIEGQSSFCEAGLKARVSTGYKGQVFMADCANPGLVSVVGASGLNGVIAVGDGSPLSNTKHDDAIYQAAMEKYAKGTPAWGSATVAPTLGTVFANINLMASVMANKVPASADFAPSAVLAAFTGLHNYPYLMDGGEPITGDHKLVSIAPAIGTTKAFVIKFNGSKEVSGGYVDFGPLLNPSS